MKESLRTTKYCVPLANGKFDRTEVDLRLGDLLIEAKLTESNFQSAKKTVLQAYRDFSDVFDWRQLPQMGDHYMSYQLLRNVLAAYALQCSFCVLVDARRPDLADAWYVVMRCVKPVKLRTELRTSTWQEVAQVSPARLRAFLAVKYGIGGETNRSEHVNLNELFDRMTREEMDAYAKDGTLPSWFEEAVGATDTDSGGTPNEQ